MKAIFQKMTTEVKTTVPGNIWKVLVKVGDTVKKDDDLFIMEVMKTEVHHNSPIDGKVIQVNIQNDQEAVEPGTVAIIIEQIMSSEKKFLTKYIDTIIELSNETGMSKKEVRTILDISLSNQNPKFINFDQIKTEIKTFITINIFSLICKL